MKKPLALLAVVVLKILNALKLNTPNRIVIALSPLFFSASGVILVLVARYCPLIGGHLTRDQLVSLFIAGATLGSSKILMWLHGWQKFEAPRGIAAGSPLNVIVGNAGTAPDRGLGGETVVPPPTPESGPPAHEVGRL